MERLKPQFASHAGRRPTPTSSVWVAPSGSPTAGIYAGTFMQWDEDAGEFVTTGEDCKVTDVLGADLTADKPYLGRIVGEDSDLPLVAVEAGGSSDPDASKTVRGYVSTGAQVYAGIKTFYSGIQIGDGLTSASGSIVFKPASDSGLAYIYGQTGDFTLSTGVSGGAAAGKVTLVGGANAAYCINQNSTLSTGVTTTFLDLAGRTVTVKGGIITSIV